MNTKPTPTVTPSRITKAIDGIVIGKNLGSWAGFNSGRISIKSADQNRVELHYGKDSVGIVPRIGDLVSVEYTGAEFFVISTIKILKPQVETIFERVSTLSSGLSLIAGRPKGAVAIVVTEVLVGISIIFLGLALGMSKPAAPFIYGVVGFAQIIIALLIWEFTSRG